MPIWLRVCEKQDGSAEIGCATNVEERSAREWASSHRPPEHRSRHSTSPGATAAVAAAITRPVECPTRLIFGLCRALVREAGCSHALRAGTIQTEATAPKLPISFRGPYRYKVRQGRRVRK